MSRRMVVLLVDALGWTLASRAVGFAAGLTERRRLDTILGFSSGALPTLFTGRMPAEHGRWLMYRRAAAREDAGSRAETPFRGFGLLRWLPARVRDSRTLTRWLDRLVARRGVRGYFHLYEVPRPLLAEFDLAERDDIFAPGGLPGDSLWDGLERRGIRWRGWNWRTEEARNFEELERALAAGRHELLFLYTADLDALLHREGSRGEAVRERLALYDQRIRRLEDVAAARGDELWLYLLSDHGMVDVRATVDLRSRLAGLGAREGADYLAFFDSTVARFWWRSKAAREAVREALAREPRGRWLERGELEREGAYFPGAEYGEDLFLLEPGALMVPSFMGSAPLAGMHGYDPAHPDMAAMLWSNRPLPGALRHLRDVRAFLESELDRLAAEAA